MRDHAVAAHNAVSRDDADGRNERRDIPTDFERLAERAISRRSFLHGSASPSRILSSYRIPAAGEQSSGLRRAGRGTRCQRRRDYVLSNTSPFQWNPSKFASDLGVSLTIR